MTGTNSSLATIIEKASSEFAAKLLDSAAKKASEAEVRSVADRELLKVEQAAGIELEARHEFTVASGRVDSVYDRVIIEYKNPSSGDRIGPTLDDPGSRKVVKQIQSRFADLKNEHGQPIETLFGVGLDGRRIVFVRFKDGDWIEEPPGPVNATTISRLLWALFNLGSSGRPFSATYLARDFGGSSSVAGSMVRALYDAILGTTDPKAQTLFEEWQALFGIICGYDALIENKQATSLASLYGITKQNVDFRKLLFAAHTYYALVMKMLSAEIVGVYHGLPSLSQRILQTTSAGRLKGELIELEAGGIFNRIGINNFLEGDLFSWYLQELNTDVQAGIRKCVEELDKYNLGSISDNPDESQDLLKDLYMALLPREVRHSLGEYYTPDWVAELTLNEAKYNGGGGTRVLDPACGSGTFLVKAIARLRESFAQNPETFPGAEKGLLEAILRNVVGFDINPLAVLASRTNFLIAIRDLLKYSGEIELPVYLADSVATPAEYQDLFTSASPVARVPCAATKPPFLFVPREVGANLKSVTEFTATIEHSLKVRLSKDEFIEELKATSVSIRDERLFAELYSTMERLRDEGRDSIWARIIKNSFAPLFVGNFDIIVGNPPWVNWENLAPEYRDATSATWEHYGLSGPLPGKRRQSSSSAKTDVCILMTYVASDKYLKKGGKVAFVLPRTIFQSEAGGWHFRQFSLPDGRPLRVVNIQDIDPLKPFRGQATNTSCVALFEADKPIKYPVKWTRWQLLKPRTELPQTLEKIEQSVKKTRLNAEPISTHQIQSPWVVGSKTALKLIKSAVGRSPYADVVREGLNTRGANGVYFVDAKLLANRLLVTNLKYEGRNDAVQERTLPLEDTHLYPLLRGKDVTKFKAIPNQFIVLPHAASAPVNPIPFASLPRFTREFLSEFRTVLEGRKKFRNFDPSNGEWHGLYSVLDATFSPHKVVWREMAGDGGVIAAAVSDSPLPSGSAKIVMPDHKLTIVPCRSQAESDYLAAFLNSDVSNLIVRSYALATGISTHILDRVAIPRYSDTKRQHIDLSTLGKKARTSKLTQAEQRKMSGLAAEILGLSKTEATNVMKELAKL